MSESLNTLIPQAALVLIALIGGWFTLRGKKVDSNTAALAGLQKQITDIKAEAADEKRILLDRIDSLERRERVRDDYIFDLRSDLADGGKPVRPWPKELTGEHA